MNTFNKINLMINNHRSDSAGLNYIYPVISRRAGGLSIGINLNPNRACNWRCIYCQVPNLTRGAAPQINLPQLETELNGLLDDIFFGDFFIRSNLPQELRHVSDLAIAGDGEPTTCREFVPVIEIIERVAQRFNLINTLPLILITNGSLIARAEIQRGLRHWAQLSGRVWFKIDRATPAERLKINNSNLPSQKLLRNLEISAHLCPTWIQTCVFTYDGNPPSAIEQQGYLDFLHEIQQREISIAGILLYGLARPSRQPEASRLGKVSRLWLEQFADRISAIGYNIFIYE